LIAFSEPKCSVAILSEPFGPHFQDRWNDAAGWCLCGAEKRAARHEHGATGNADGVYHRAHNVRSSKRRAPADKFIEIGRFDMRIAKGADRIRPLVIGKKEQDVWTIRSGKGRPGK